MKLVKAAIQDIKGIDSLQFATGALTLIEGRNGEGKTSIIDSIRSPFEGGHDPSLIRTGAKKGVVTLTLDTGATIKRTITARTSTTEITTPDGAVVKSPAAYIETLASSFAFDPLAFIEADPKKRAKFLLEAMPINFSQAEVRDTVKHMPDVLVANDYDLDGLNVFRKALYDRRTQINTTYRDLEGIIKSLRDARGEEDETEWAGVIASLEATRDGLVKDETERRSAITAEANGERAKRDFTGREREIRDRLQVELDALAKEQSEFERAIGVAEAGAVQQIKNELDPKREQLASEIATAREKHAAQQRSLGAREECKKYEDKAANMQVGSTSIDAALDRIDNLKRKKLELLPIEGVETRDGEVYVGGLPFEQLNTQQQYFIAFQIGALKLGKLPLMICDRGEALDAENWAAFQEAAKESGIQVIAARVTDSALQVHAA